MNRSVTYRARPEWTCRGLLVCAGLLLAPPALAQEPVPFTNINPRNSSLDPFDPDGASGGRINGLASTPGNSKVFYAATEWGGLYKTYDAGNTWTRLKKHLPNATWDVEVHPGVSQRVYATSYYDGRIKSLAGINVSRDGGATWFHPASATPPSGFCEDPVAREEPSAYGISASSSHVYVGTNCGLAISSDRGETWRYVDPTPATRATTVADVLVHHGGIIDVCGFDGHRRSTDGGKTWTTATSSPLPSAARCSLAASPDESHVLFAVAGVTLFESDNGGKSWAPSLPNPTPQGRIPFVAVNNRTGRAFDLWLGDVSLFRTSCTTPSSTGPGGAPRCNPAGTWAGGFTRGAGGHDDMGDLAFNPLATENACPLVMSSDGGAYRNTRVTSPDCHTPQWEQPNLTPNALWPFSMGGARVVGLEAEHLYFGNQDNGTFATMNAGAAAPTWKNSDCCDGFDVVADPSVVLHTVCCYGGGRATRLFKSGPGISGAAEINTYPPGTFPGWRYNDSVDRFGPNRFVAITSEGAFITPDINASPITWTQLGTLAFPWNSCGVKAAGTSTDPVFFVQSGSCNGSEMDQVFRYRGTAPGGTWEQINPPGGTGGFGIFAAQGLNPDLLLASHLSGSTVHMVKSTDGGATWTVDTGLDKLMTGGGAFRYVVRQGPIDFWGVGRYVQPTLVAFDPKFSQIRVAGAADSGLFLTTNGGTSWRLITEPMTGGVDPVPHLPRPRYAYFSHESEGAFIYFGSQGRGVWRADISGVLGVGSLRLSRNAATLQCTRYPCRAMQPLQRACREQQLDCPACPGGTCPAYVHLTLKGVRPDWNVWLEDSRQQPVEHQQFRQGNTLVLSFQPAEGREPLAGYQVIYEVGEGRPGQRHVVGASMRTAEAPFQGRGFSAAPVARRTPMEWEETARAVGGAGAAGQEPPPPPPERP